MEINLKFKDGRVINASCWTDGCVHSLNSVCAAADMAKGKSPDDIVQIDAGLIQESVGGLPQDHLHCAQLAAETLQAALEDYMIRSVRNGKR
jgi:nitrogen fixation NifU-like protein